MTGGARLQLTPAVVCRERLERVLAFANRAPSTDNCQPFRLCWDGVRLEIFHEDVRAQHVMNAHNLASYLSLGCLLEALRVAAAAEGLDTCIDLADLEPASRQPWAIVHFTDRRRDEPPLTAAPLLGRWTDRRSYRGGSVADAVFREVEREVSSFRRARLHLRAPTSALIDYLADIEALVWTWEPAQQGIAKWFRLNRDEVERTRDGLPLESLAANVVMGWILRLSRADFRYQRLLNRLGFLSIFRQRVRDRVRSAGALGCVTVEAPSMASVVEAGELTMRAWLRLNAGGYGFQPISSGTLLILAAAAGVLPAQLPGAFGESIERGRSVLHAGFQLGASEIPAWLFRTGVAPSRMAQPPTLRLDLAEILTVRDHRPTATPWTTPEARSAGRDRAS